MLDAWTQIEPIPSRGSLLSDPDEEEMAMDALEVEPEQQEAAAVAEVTAVVHGHGGATAIHAPSRSRPGIPRT